jgi:long-chain acyl-CoA synthetase
MLIFDLSVHPQFYSPVRGAGARFRAMNKTLSRRWAATVARAPRRIAVVEASSGKRWTRATLDAAAAQWAATHRHAELSGRRVAMSVPNGAEWFRIFLGLLACGAVPAPLDPSEPEEAQLSAARSIGASFLWREGRLLPVSGARAATTVRRECLVKVTSGSSGAPRGLGATHAQMEADGRQICRSMGIGPGDINLAAIPLGYSYGLGNLVLPLILQGTRIVCSSSPLPHAIGSDAGRYRPTVFPAVPSILRALAASELDPRSLSSLRLVISAGSPVTPQVCKDFASRFGIRIHGFYGTSETGGIAFDRTGDATLLGRSVGSPLGGVRVRQNRGGRITVSGKAVLGKGRFSPADRARLNADGELVLLGRTDRVVKVAGRRLDLAEIEAAMRMLPGVREAFAHVGSGADAPLAAAVATELAPAEVRRLLRARVASWKVPARIVALAQFPMSARGKPDAHRLRQLLSAPRTVTSISMLRADRQISAPR